MDELIADRPPDRPITVGEVEVFRVLLLAVGACRTPDTLAALTRTQAWAMGSLTHAWEYAGGTLLRHRPSGRLMDVVH